MTPIRPSPAASVAVAACCVAAALAWSPVAAQTLGPDFQADYTAVNIGSVPGLPSNYGGLTFLDANTLLIGGAANGATGRLYTIDVVRGAGGGITGFAGSAVRYGGATAGIGDYNDGGVTFGPGGVLFTSRWPVNGLGQTRPGSTDEDRIIDLAPLGVANSNAAIGFVPAGFGGAGQIKLVSWSGGQWYSASVAPDGAGTYDLVGVTPVDLNPAVAGVQNVPGGPEGFVWIGGANAGFGGTDSMLISEYSAGVVGAYQVDAQGNPLVATRRVFLSGLTGAEGATIDPVTGDFLFSTFGGGSRVVRVTGFIAPPPIPEPGTWALMLAGVAAVGAATRRRRVPG